MAGGLTKLTFRRPRDGIKVPYSIDNDLKDVLDRAKLRNKKDWDYSAIISGYSGTGKSTLINHTLAPYCCPWFSEKYICLSAEEFIKVTTKCHEYSAVSLDESFAPLNSRTIFTPEFLRVVNHLQLIRFKRLFIFIALPNFFDLAKQIGIFKTSHLFVPYEVGDGDRGKFLAWGKEEKKKLFVRGQKFMDYHAEPANFIGSYCQNPLVIDDRIYNQKKIEHFKKQDKIFERKQPISRYDYGKVCDFVCKDYKEKGFKIKDTQEMLSKAFGVSYDVIREWKTNYRKGKATYVGGK